MQARCKECLGSGGSERLTQRIQRGLFKLFNHYNERCPSYNTRSALVKTLCRRRDSPIPLDTRPDFNSNISSRLSSSINKFTCGLDQNGVQTIRCRCKKSANQSTTDTASVTHQAGRASRRQEIILAGDDQKVVRRVRDEIQSEPEDPTSGMATQLTTPHNAYTTDCGAWTSSSDEQRSKLQKQEEDETISCVY